MGLRLFTAVIPPLDVVEELDAFLAPRRDAEARLRWTRPESWHLTTAFMGDVGESHLDRLTENLAAVAARTPAFDLQLSRGGAFPWPKETKHLWLGVSMGSEELVGLAARCRTAASTAGIVVDGTRFTPHLTLARANRPIDSTRLITVLDAADLPPFGVRELALVASHLHDRANRYEVLETFELAPAGARDA